MKFPLHRFRSRQRAKIMVIVFKDPEQAELGTYTYRCKGCNGKGCRWCCFGDMWESDKKEDEDEN